MIKNIMRLVVASAIAVFAAPIFADGHGCKISARVSIVGNEFPAIHAVADGAKVCKGSEVKANLTADHQKINVAFYNFNIDKKEDLNTIKEALNLKILKKPNIKKFGFPKVVDNYLNSHS